MLDQIEHRLVIFLKHKIQKLCALKISCMYEKKLKSVAAKISTGVPFKNE